MTRGAMVKQGIVYDIVDAASDLDEAYGQDGKDTIAFVPSDTAQIGDTWTNKVGFTDMAVARVNEPTATQIQAALVDFGLSQEGIDKIMEIASGK